VSCSLMVTCEHSGNKVPARYSRLFKESREILDTHRGYDIGARKVYHGLCRRLRPDFSIEFNYTRLLIDVNRSENSRTLLSSFSRHLTDSQANEVIRKLYIPYRQAIKGAVESLTKHRPVIHLSVHSFTPVFKGYLRNVDVGLLYDPGRSSEAAICKVLRNEICNAVKSIRVRLNSPYRGTSDGITSWLRSQFPTDQYCGIELEINQHLL
jgi:predicted N-formylglutamate amidohydrolase